MEPKSEKVLPKRQCTGYIGCEIPRNVSPATFTENADGTSIWREEFPFGDFIDQHFLTEMDREAFEDWGIEKCFNVMKAAPIQEVSIVRFMEQKVSDLLKKNEAYEEENTELKNKLLESEKNICNLNKGLEELISKTSQLVESEEGLMEENAKMLLKLDIKENIVNKMEAEIKDLKAEIEDLEAKNEELRNEIILQHKVGFHKAINQVLVSVFELKP